MSEYSKSNAVKFENRLNSLCELPVGLLTAQNYQLILKKESGLSRLKTSIKTIYSLGKKKGLSFENPAADLDKTKSYVVLTLIQNDSRYKDFMLPVCDDLTSRGKDVILICPEGFIKARPVNNSGRLHLIDWETFNRSPISPVFKQFKAAPFINTCLAHGLNLVSALRLMLLGRLRVDRLNNFMSFLRSVRVESVLTEYDRNTKVAPLVVAANFNDIPTYTLVHGSIVPPDTYYPFAAKRVLTWGNNQASVLASLGFPDELFFNVGNNRISKLTASREQELAIKERLQINRDPRIATLITNKVKEEDRLLFARVFIEAIENLEGWFGIIKLHPLEKVSDYKDKLSGIDPEKIRIYASKDLGNEDLAVITQVFVNHNSIMGLEMLVQNKPVIILDCISYDIGIGREMTESGACIKATDSKSLTAAILHAEQHQLENHTAIESYVKEYFYNIGEDATKNIVNCLLL